MIGLLLVAGFLAILVVGMALATLVAGPDPDRASPWLPDGNWFGRHRCVCGEWSDEVRHVHPGWTDRGPR